MALYHKKDLVQFVEITKVWAVMTSLQASTGLHIAAKMRAGYDKLGYRLLRLDVARIEVMLSYNYCKIRVWHRLMISGRSG